MKSKCKQGLELNYVMIRTGGGRGLSSALKNWKFHFQRCPVCQKEARELEKIQRRVK